MLRNMKKNEDLRIRSGGALKLHLHDQAPNRSEPGSPWPPPSLTMASSGSVHNASNNRTVLSPTNNNLSPVSNSVENKGSVPASIAPYLEPVSDEPSSQESQSSALGRALSLTQSIWQGLKFGSAPPNPNEQPSTSNEPEGNLYPSLPSPYPVPGSFPISPAIVVSEELPKNIPLSPPHSEGRGSDHSSSRGRGTPITSLAIHSPSPTRHPQTPRTSSPFSLESRIRKHNNRPSTPSMLSDAGTETSSENGFIQINKNGLFSPGHRYPPIGHRTVERSPLPDLGDLKERLEEMDKTPMPRTRNMPSGSGEAGPSVVAPIPLSRQPLNSPPPSFDIDEAVAFEEEMMTERRVKPETREVKFQEEDEDIPTRTASPVDDWRASTAPPRLPSNDPYDKRGISAELEEEFPVYVKQSYDHQALWDRLPVGTLFNVALVSSEWRIDLNAMHPDQLERLCGKNISLEQVERILGVENINRVPQSDEAKMLDELNWEAEQIVSGSGNMLGYREEKGDRYGGKVQFSATLRIDESILNKPGPMDLEYQGKITLDPPCLRGSSIFTRTFGSHRFLRVKMAARIRNEVSVWIGDAESRKRAKINLKEWACRPIYILGRIWRPLLEKDGVVIYFLEGRDMVGEVFERGAKGYGIRECTTRRQLLDWWIPFEQNQDQTESKLFTRLELGVSDTLPGLFIEPEHVERVPDIVNDDGKMFTDGAGLMTPSIARALMDKYYGGATNELHVSYQVRLQTAKGVVIVDPVMLANRDFEGPHRVRLYSSMCKARRGKRDLRPGPVRGLHILDAAACMLCIVKPAPASSSKGARLSAQFITILSDCGVPTEILANLQAASLRKELDEWTKVEVEGMSGSMRLDEATRLRLAKLIGRSQAIPLMTKKKELAGEARGYGYGRIKRDPVEEEETSDEDAEARFGLQRFESFSSEMTTSERVEKPVETWSHNEISGFPMFKSMALQDALYCGIEVWKSRYWFGIWKDLATEAMRSIVSKFHLTVERSASGFFQPDPTGLLRPGEIFFRPKEAMIDSTTGLRVENVLGPVIIGRHPALLPTDMTKVTAVSISLLESFKGIVFCSVHGDISLAELCAGGDHDGDEAMIIWEPSIVETFKDPPPELRIPPTDFESRFEKTSNPIRKTISTLQIHGGQYYSKRLSEILMGSVGEWDTFKIYNWCYNMASFRDGLRGSIDPNGIGVNMALLMAHTFNKLMDGKKMGVRIKDDVLAEDKIYWSAFEEPYWRQQQKKAKAATPNKGAANKRRLPAFEGFNILDHLVMLGKEELNRAMAQLEETVQPKQEGAGFLYFNGSGKDMDLLGPWEEAKEDRMKRADCGVIQAVVEKCYRDVKTLNKDSARKTCTARDRTGRLRSICREFATNPSLDELPSFGSEEEVRIVRASCAYALDIGSVSRGGDERGFAWNIALRDLCAIKARAISNGDTITIPHSVRDRLETHKFWSSL